MKRINGIRIYENGILINIVPKKNKLNAEQKELLKTIESKKQRKSLKKQFKTPGASVNSNLLNLLKAK